jgi:hypothetical protein
MTWFSTLEREALAKEQQGAEFDDGRQSGPTALPSDPGSLSGPTPLRPMPEPRKLADTGTNIAAGTASTAAANSVIAAEGYAKFPSGRREYQSGGVAGGTAEIPPWTGGGPR